MAMSFNYTNMKRITYIDNAKTICIFLMVVGHWTSNDILIRYIYSFHMPALFIISGYLYKPRLWMKTILSFGIPVAFYSFLNLGFLLAIREISVSSLLSKEVFFRFFHYRYGLGDGLYMGDWFIWALLGLRLLFGDLNSLKILKRYYLMIGVCVIIYMSVETYFLNINSIFRGWYIGLLIPSLPFFYFGFLLKDLNWIPYNVSLSRLILLITVFIVTPIVNGSSSINSQEYGCSYAIFFINASASSLLLFYISNHIPSTDFCTVTSKGTLLILGLHMPLIKIMSVLLPLYFSFLIPFFIMLLCYYPIKWLDMWCPPLLGRIK